MMPVARETMESTLVRALMLVFILHTIAPVSFE
jgi:hypothetical protein